MNIPHFVHLFVDGHKLFPPLGLYGECCCEYGCADTFLRSYFQFFWIVLRSELAESYGGSVFNFLRSLHTVFRNDCTVSPSHKQCTRAHVSPHAPQHLFSSLFWPHHGACRVLVLPPPQDWALPPLWSMESSPLDCRGSSLTVFILTVWGLTVVLICISD